ncbi:asparagine synthase-related protein, partial [Streptomyces sp. FH025]|uniref:asparagine synthase-related protein n=1 Tax=Streptomyces sp. FH025 TaxID=2815937 RepID=UPI001AC209E4
MQWFVAVPDCPAGLRVLEDLRPPWSVLVRHASGRPWLVGRVPTGHCQELSTGDRRVAVIGRARPDAAVLDRLLASLSVDHGVPGPSPVAGSAHVAVSEPGRFRLHGTASGLRRVYAARVHGVTVAADRADVLAGLSAAGTDERWLAVQLIADGPPHPLDRLTPWTGVLAVPPGDALTVDAEGGSAQARWWSPPKPDRPLTTGAPALRSALAEAVALRVAATPASTLGCDLSGGMDSTALAFLANDAGAPLHTLTLEFRDPANDDTRWADLARSHLPDAVALDLPQDRLPGQYANLGRPRTPTDAPSGALRGRAVLEASSARYREHGIGLQLAGHGG